MMEFNANFVRSLTDGELSDMVIAVFARNLNNGRLNGKLNLLQDFISTEELPLVAFEEMLLLEFIWRNLQLPQTEIRALIEDNPGVDAANIEEFVSQMSVRERN